jgi:hypothetical protein
VHAVETLANGRRGDVKRDAAIAALNAMVRAVMVPGAVETIGDPEIADALRQLAAAGGSPALLVRPDVAVAMRNMVDAYVDLQNAIARAGALPPAGHA